ncbi:HAMP domain-containing methyl-accepting chemotaxis protein [Patulibacter sp. SYSU D01012]|uniref:methyl-accepting chemotaxis protein n=1 Tax=Patulibacter sp. SYSU D01012 TaxID=2817381 RepID=UPI001B30B19E|nr:HAMP domain-containing methyl-accepting chemotaxis protein [Patulibacter sp. SYSU D01012]
MLSRFNDLRLAHRLAVAFGALGLALLVVTLVGVSGFGTVNDATGKVSDRDVPALDIAGSLDTQASVRLTTEHLYVYDGDAQNEKRIAAQLTARGRANAAAGKRIATLVRGTAVEAPVAKLLADRAELVAAITKAIRLSTAETARGADDRSGSRTVYTDQIMPLADRVLADSDAVRLAVRAMVGRHVDDAQSAGTSARRLMIIVALVFMAVAALIAVATTRAIVRPVRALQDRVRSLNANCLNDLTNALEAVTQGDLTQHVGIVTKPLDVRSKDELGELSATFNVMLARAQGSIGSYNTMRTQLADMIGELATSAGTVSSASEQLTSTSEETSKAVSEIATAIVDVATGAETQVQRIGVVQDAMGETVEIVGRNGRSAEEAAHVAEEARERTERGVEAVQSADAAMSAVQANSQETATAIAELAEKSQQIGQFVETITAISAQTNLLALNAAIEAARAGEQGRGFAVVAEEVRKLAEESNEAAETIAGLVEQIQRETSRAVEVVEDGVRRTEQGTEIVADARSAFEAIGAAVDDMGARITAIAAAGQEILASSERVSSDIGGVASVAESSSATAEQVSASTQQTSASAEQISASAQELSATAQTLEQLVQRFRVAA